MLKFENVDVLSSLERIMLQNTAFFQGDFDIDKDIICRAASSGQREDKFLLWMSRPSGTHCLSERDVLLRDSGAHNTWTYYDKYTNDKVLAYAVKLRSMEDNIVRGDLYELDYQAHCKRVKEQALQISAKRVIYENGIRDIPEDLRRSIHFYPDPKLGKPLHFEYLPHDPEHLQDTLNHERAFRTQTAAIGNLEKHLCALRRNRIYAEAHYLSAEFKKLSEPNNFLKNQFVVRLSRQFSRLASDADCGELIAILPYKSLIITELQGDGELYALIDKNERRNVQLRKNCHST